MHPLRLAFLLCFAFVAAPLFGQGTPPPFTFDKAFSAEQTITMKDGTTLTNKFYMDNGRVRTEMSGQGMNMVAIVRPDQQKVYTLMPAQRMAMVLPYDPAKSSKYNVGAAAFDGKIDPVGSDTVDGVACNKYKITTSDGKIFYLWVDAAKQQPLKMTADDGSFTVLWKNYQAGAQPASLFEVPSDYQTMAMPSMPGMPPGAPSGQ